MHFAIIIILLFFGVPFLLTGFNISALIKQMRKSRKKEKSDISEDTTELSDGAIETNPIFPENRANRAALLGTDILIFLLGISYTLLLWGICSFRDWYLPIYGQETLSTSLGSYSPIYLKSLPTILTFACVAIVGFWILRIFKTKLPPIIAAFCYSSILIGFVLTAVWVIQLMKVFDNFYSYCFMLFPINYCICSIRLMHETVAALCEKIAQTEYKNAFMQKCKRFISRSHGFMLLAFIIMIPLILLTVIILTLFGQAPDAAIKAFTETAEWTLSQKIPPPRESYPGHYLCTVAACGDEKTVKPIRVGKRYGQLIIVNRQLLVANAFEDLIKEHTPRFHKLVRGIYDKYGLPISKHINTKKKIKCGLFHYEAARMAVRARSLHV